MIVPDWVKVSGNFALKILFPPHHRKITNMVISIGAALILDGYLLDGLIAWLAQLLVAQFTGTALPIWGETESETGVWAGVILIGMSLVYSVVVLAVETSVEKNSRANAAILRKEAAASVQHVLRRDHQIYREFLQEFGSNGRLEYFISNHNFGSSWRKELTDLLDNFVVKWSAPEKQFQFPEINQAFRPMLNNMSQLIEHLSVKGGYLQANSDFYCILDPSIHNDFEMPEYISTAIDVANTLGVELKEQRRSFIEVSERNFAALPVESA